ncbi:MAG: hypothetical protein LQ349_002094 [Xanthoria aureola]|nr:MAG: hypothetical protein LQ349_002094 [Xanthoria aureola]
MSRKDAFGAYGNGGLLERLLALDQAHRLYFLYPTLVCIRPHTDPDSPCLLCMMSKDGNACVCAKFKDKYLETLKRLQQAARRFHIDSNPQTLLVLEITQVELLNLDQPVHKAISPGIGGSALNRLIRHLVFSQIVIVSDSLRILRNFDRIRQFTVSDIVQPSKVLPSLGFKPNVLEAIAIQMVGIQPKHRCTRCREEEGFFKQYIQLDPHDKAGALLSNKCSNYYMLGRAGSYEPTIVSHLGLGS